MTSALAAWRGRGALVLLIALVIFGAAFVPNFATLDNLVDIVQSQSFIGVAAIGMTYVVLSGQFVDLSVPAVMAASANAVLALVDHHVGLAIAAGVLIPLAVGLANGLLVGLIGANPVLTTLGLATLVAGILFRATDGAYSAPTSSGLQDFGSSKPLGIPVEAIIFVGLLIVAQISLSRTRFGAYVIQVGANRAAARASGIPSGFVIACCFLLCAVLAGVAGILLGAFTNQADLTTGTGYEFGALAAVVIGGTTLLGGIGSFWRTLVGVLVIGISNNMMLLEGFDVAKTLFTQGAILILAVVLDALASRGKTR